MLFSFKWVNIFKNLSNPGQTYSLPCFQVIFKESSLISKTSMIQLLGNGQRRKPFNPNLRSRNLKSVNMTNYFKQNLQPIFIAKNFCMGIHGQKTILYFVVSNTLLQLHIESIVEYSLAWSKYKRMYRCNRYYFRSLC